MATEPSDWPNRGKGAQIVKTLNLDSEFQTTKALIPARSRADWEKKETKK